MKEVQRSSGQLRELKLTERDRSILKGVLKWGTCLSRQVQQFASFSGSRAMYRRLSLLIQYGYLERKRYIYGLPGIITATRKAQRAVSSTIPPAKVKLAELEHDITVIDCYLYFKEKYALSSDFVLSELEIKRKRDIAFNKHAPDFSHTHEDKEICVEIELSLKNEERLKNNVADNYLNYDTQIWIVREENAPLIKKLKAFETEYPNIEVIFLEEVQQHGGV